MGVVGRTLPEEVSKMIQEYFVVPQLLPREREVFTDEVRRGVILAETNQRFREERRKVFGNLKVAVVCNYLYYHDGISKTLLHQLGL